MKYTLDQMTQETENDTRKYESKKESYDDNRKMIESYLLSGKLNAAFSVRLKQALQSI